MDIVLYNNSAEPNRVDKSSFITQKYRISITLKDSASVTNMSIRLKLNNNPDFNYAYIPLFNRYYFITDIKSIRNNIWEISLSVDVLMTYKDAIYEQIGFIDRNEYEYNNDIIDKKRVISQGFDIEHHIVTNTLFNNVGSYILTGFDLSLKGQ